MAIKKYSSGVWAPTSYRKYGTETDTITNLPAQIIGDGQAITSCQISGNTAQNGTPTPEAPVDVVGCGVRTGNLFDITTLENGIYLAASGNKYGNATDGVRAGTKIKVLPNTAYTLSAQSSEKVSLRILEWGNGIFIKQTPKYNMRDSVSLTVTTTAETTEIAFNVEGENGQYVTNTMLNAGSTALPYEPYGYKLPLTVNGTKYPIYLGQVETTRRIKKLVLTGKEHKWNVASTNLWHLQISDTPAVTILDSRSLYCTHYNGVASKTTYSDLTIGNACIYNSIFIWIRDARFTSLSDFKSYLFTQYSAGTPVTVWYALGEPETGIVNEPLHKIGGYADTVTVTSIPTTGTPESFDVLTTLKPSEVQLTYHGWHEHADTKYTQGE